MSHTDGIEGVCNGEGDVAGTAPQAIHLRAGSGLAEVVGAHKNNRQEGKKLLKKRRNIGSYTSNHFPHFRIVIFTQYFPGVRAPNSNTIGLQVGPRVSRHSGKVYVSITAVTYGY